MAKSREKTSKHTKFWFTTNANRGIGAEITKAALVADTFFPAKPPFVRGRRPKANRSVPALHHASGFRTWLLQPQGQTQNRAVCPRSLLRRPGLWSTNGR
jgi:hypothetical protein